MDDKWLEVSVDTTDAGIEDLAAYLTVFDTGGLVIEDEAEFRAFLEQNRQYWDYVDEELDRSMAGKCRLTFYLEQNEEGLGKIAAVRIAMAELKDRHPEYAPLLLTMEGVEDADWENNWKQFYKPMEIGDRLIVIPDWEEADPQGRVALRLNPGLTFGTGSHATTRLCLQALEKLVRPGMSVLDLGCGSGILSIAALLLGADRAFEGGGRGLRERRPQRRGEGPVHRPGRGRALRPGPPPGHGGRLGHRGGQHRGRRDHRPGPGGPGPGEARRGVPLLRDHRPAGR